jgi:hypothetical protein
MFSRKRRRWAGSLVLAAGLGMACAHAQVPPSTEETDRPTIKTTDGAGEPEEADIKDLELDWSQLNVDASTLMAPRGELKSRLAPRAGANSEVIWSSREQTNGSAVSVKQSVFGEAMVDAKVGADMTVVREPTTLSELLSEKALNGGNEPQSGGTAWATITAPGAGSLWDKTAVEARLDPAQDQTKLGTSLSKSLDLGEQYSLPCKTATI